MNIVKEYSACKVLTYNSIIEYFKTNIKITFMLPVFWSSDLKICNNKLTN